MNNSGFLNPAANSKNLFNKGLLGIAIVAVVLGATHTPYMGLASFNYFLLILGLLALKHKPALHPKFMTTAIALDLALVLILQIQRNAVKTAAGFTLEPLQQLHILFSLLAVILYFPVFFLGHKRQQGLASEKQKSAHKNLGIITFIARTLGFLLMFTMTKTT